MLPALLLYGGLFVVPFASVVLTSLTPSAVLAGGPLDGAPLANYAYLLARLTYLEAVGRTGLVGLGAALAAGALAIPTALALRRLPPGLLGPALLVLALPMLVGPLVLALGWLAVLAPNGPLAGLAAMLGLAYPRLVGTEWGVLVALAYYGFPFATLLLLAGLLQVDRDLEAAARTDGAGRADVLRRVTWPLARSALAAGTLLALLLALSAYVAPRYLGGEARPVLTMTVSQYVLGTFDRPLAATSATILVVTSLLAALLWPRPAAYPMEAGLARDERAAGRGGASAIGGPALAWLAVAALLLLLPLVVVLAGSFSAAALFPGPPRGLSLDWYARVLADRDVRAAAGLSVVVALGATALAALAALPAAVRLARTPSRGLLGLLTAPLAAPQLVLGLGVLELCARLGIGTGTMALVLAHALFVAPVVLRAALAALERLDPAIAEAAAIDGAGPVRAFVLVVLPRMAGGLIGGVALAFALSFTNVPLSLFLATPTATPLPILMLARLETRLDPGLAALSVLVLLASGLAGLLALRAAGPRAWL